MIHFKARLQASIIHLSLSLLIALLAATLVFSLWYPYPYREVSGGQDLFFIIVAVDVIMGPLLTFVIFNRAKPTSELRRDLAMVILLQLAALGYGMWTVFIARPVHLVFEIDRFRVVHEADVIKELMPKASAEFQELPLFSRGLLSVRPFVDGHEKADATLAAVQGINLGSRPDFWQPYVKASAQIRQEAQPAKHLLSRFPDHAILINDAVNKTGRSIDNLLSLPMVSRKLYWTALVDDETLDVVGFIPLDSF